MERAEINYLKRGELAYHILFSIADESRNEIASKAQVSEAGELYALRILDDYRSFVKLVNATRKGLPYQSLRRAQGIMPFSLQEWAKFLHVSTRSIDRLKKEKKRLNSSQSEKLIEITLLYDYGVEVFGSSDKFSKWLSRTHIALGGVEPKALLDTNQGIKAVKAELSKIEHGVLA